MLYLSQSAVAENEESRNTIKSSFNEEQTHGNMEHGVRQTIPDVGDRETQGLRTLGS